MTDSARDLLAEIDATLKLGRLRHLDFRVRAFDLLVRLRPLVEREFIAGRCAIYEYDGAYKCYTHDRVWGAITNPVEPCPGWEPAP